MKRLLLVARDFAPAALGGVYRPLKWARYLAEEGWRVTVLTGPVSSPYVDYRLLEDLHGREVRVIEVSGRAVADRIGQVGTASPGRRTEARRSPSFSLLLHGLKRLLYGYALIPDRHLLWLLQIFRHLETIRTFGPFDAVVSTSPPHSTHLVGAFLSAELGVPWAVDFRDAWVGNPFNIDEYHTQFRAWVERHLEQCLLRRASLVISTTEPATLMLKTRYPDRTHDFVTLYNGFDPADFAAALSAADCSRPAPARPLQILYVGSVGGTRDPRALLEACRIFQRNHPHRRVRITFLGAFNSPKEPWLALGDTIVFEDPVSHLDAVSRMCAADVLLIMQLSASGCEFAIPGKLFEYIAARRPILGLLDPGPARSIITEHALGLVADPNDAAEIEAALAVMYERFQPMFDRLAQAPIPAVFDRRQQVKTLAGWLSTLN